MGFAPATGPHNGKGTPTMDIVLIGGLWLEGSVWSEVAASLERHGHRPVPLTLPGQDDGATSATLAEQLATVLAAIDASARKPMVVGHSAACALAWLAADARPEQIAKVVLIGGFPSTDGEAYADFFEHRDGAMPFPGWGPFEGPDSADLDEDARRRLAEHAIPVPEGVTRAVVRLTDERRFAVPTVVVCPEFSPTQAREWIDAGQAPELAKAENLELVDIDSGHWPMISKPAELARLLSDLAPSDGA
jgi:pimeloyl-ACP methyl ester carboxylesterase